MMRNQVRQLTSLLDDLLDVSSIARGKLALRRRIVPLVQLVEAAAASTAARLADCGQRLIVSLPGEPLQVDADPRRIEQVLANLLVNASKYSDPETEIRLEVRGDGGEAVIEVSDHGFGIDAEMIDRIFEPFLQAPRRDDKPMAGGLGIGLTLVRQLAEMHGGSATARSAGPGFGSTFTVRLPLATGAAPQIPVQHLEGLTLAERRILVVDDNLNAATALTELLNLRGCHARAATSGGEALAAVQRGDLRRRPPRSRPPRHLRVRGRQPPPQTALHLPPAAHRRLRLWRRAGSRALVEERHRPPYGQAR